MAGLFSNTQLVDMPSMAGRLAGEWSLPVCDQGKNTWGYDYTTNSLGSSVGHLPCACGYQGNTTADFFVAINVQGSELESLAYYCCEGGLLFPNATRAAEPDQGRGAVDLNGGIWTGSLFYGYSGNKNVSCNTNGQLLIDGKRYDGT